MEALDEDADGVVTVTVAVAVRGALDEELEEEFPRLLLDLELALEAEEEFESDLLVGAAGAFRAASRFFSASRSQ